MGKHIQSSVSAIPSVRPVFYPYGVFLDGTHNCLPKGTVYVPKFVESKRGHVVIVADGRCFGSSGTCRDDRVHSGIGRGDDPCFQEDSVDGGGEVKAKVSKNLHPRFALMDTAFE